MKTRSVFTREKVLDAALAITREHGWIAVNARSVARRLGSSTMPIYSNLRSMDELAREVMERGEKLLREYQGRPFTDNPALNLAIGYVAFAKKEPRLFRLLYAERPRRVGRREMGQQSQQLERTMEGAQELREMVERIPELKTNRVVLNSWIFVHGLASLVSSGALDLPEKRLPQLLAEAGGAFVNWEKLRKERKNG
jgi:AcrR family transcriptional regulator